MGTGGTILRIYADFGTGKHEGMTDPSEDEVGKCGLPTSAAWRHEVDARADTHRCTRLNARCDSWKTVIKGSFKGRHANRIVDIEDRVCC